MKRIVCLLGVCLALVLAACEKMTLDDMADKGGSEKGNVAIRANMFDIVPFNDTRAVQNIASYCTRLCFVLYQDGEQVKKVLQKQGDTNYGYVTVRLEAGTYQLLVLGHSSGNPSLTNPEKIQFTNSTSYSDTFFYYGDLQVDDDETAEHDIALQRATSMARFIITDEKPANVVQVRVRYSGETGVLNAVTGWGGTVNSQQYIMYDVEGKSSPLTLDAYTFLRDEEGSLNVTLTAYDKELNNLYERELKDVPIKNHMMTVYRGTLFSELGKDHAFTFTADTDWEVFEEHNF